MQELYFEDLQVLFSEKRTLETPKSPPIERETIERYVELTGDNHSSHSDLDYNLQRGYKDIFVPGNLIPGFVEGFLRQYFRYMLHIYRGGSVKPLRPLYPGDSIIIIDAIVKVNPHPRLVIDNSSPVIIRRGIIRMPDRTLTGIITLDCLINRKTSLVVHKKS